MCILVADHVMVYKCYCQKFCKRKYSRINYIFYSTRKGEKNRTINEENWNNPGQDEENRLNKNLLTTMMRLAIKCFICVGTLFKYDTKGKRMMKLASRKSSRIKYAFKKIDINRVHQLGKRNME